MKPVINDGRFSALTLIAACCMLITFILSALGSNAYARSDLKTSVPDLCYQCHVKLKEGLSDKYVHFPFKQGMCISCHNSHVSDTKGLLKDKVDAVCLGCHKGIRNLIRKSSLHGALKEGVCTDCHTPHSGKNKYLLVSKEKKLCWNCHGNLKGQLDKPEIHAVFKEGKCSSCHDAHASSEEDQLLAAPAKLCKSCHNVLGCKAGGVSITYVTKRMNCTECHSGHASDAKGLLGPYGHTAFLKKDCEQCHNPFVANGKITTKVKGEALCLGCHKDVLAKFKVADVHGADAKNVCTMCHNPHASKNKDLTVNASGICLGCHEKTEKRTLRMEKRLKSIRCVPVKDGKCFACHVPRHSSQPLYFRTDDIVTCSRCHESQHEITHPLGAGVIDPRNGKTLTCISCHSMHSAKADFMLAFDRKRQLCIQCHKK